MRDEWYGDKRDLVKWGILLRLTECFQEERILQVAFYRPSDFGQLVIDGRSHDVPLEVIDHFRDIGTIGALKSEVKITVFDSVFDDRAAYIQQVLSTLSEFARERCIVFLDPDTGLQPKQPNWKHVLDSEAKDIWNNYEEGRCLCLLPTQDQSLRSGMDRA